MFEVDIKMLACIEGLGKRNLFLFTLDILINH